MNALLNLAVRTSEEGGGQAPAEGAASIPPLVYGLGMFVIMMVLLVVVTRLNADR